MQNSYDFLKLVLDSIAEHIVVINENGEIQYTNKSWCDFGNENSCTTIGKDWNRINYLDECDKAANSGDSFGEKAAIGIREVIDGRKSTFYLEYPCHSPTEDRWFMMRVTPLIHDSNKYFVISHHNITERVFAEEQVRKLAKLDGLTNIPNRRAFDEFIHQEWRRCMRLNSSLCVLIIDIDFFKLLNDRYGHQAGDACLKKMATSLKEFAKRPSDICAGYGGEEFAMVWGNMSMKESLNIARNLMQDINNLKIPNHSSPIEPYLTISLGLSITTPTQSDDVNSLIFHADQMLYKAKENGRNRIEYEYHITKN